MPLLSLPHTNIRLLGKELSLPEDGAGVTAMEQEQEDPTPG